MGKQRWIREPRLDSYHLPEEDGSQTALPNCIRFGDHPKQATSAAGEVAHSPRVHIPSVTHGAAVFKDVDENSRSHLNAIWSAMFKRNRQETKISGAKCLAVCSAFSSQLKATTGAAAVSS